MNKKDYKKAVKKLNCKYAKKNGSCSLSKEYCPLGPCLDFKPKYSKRKLRKINRICEKNNIIIEGKRIEYQKLDGLSWSFKLSNKADELKQVCRNMFPNFPWLMFEREIEQGIIDGRLLDFATCKDFVAKIETAFNDGMHDLYGYDTKKYGTTCNNGISEDKLFQVLVDYAKLHFIYFCKSYEVKNEN